MLREDSCREREREREREKVKVKKLSAEGTEVGAQSSRRVLGGARILRLAFVKARDLIATA